MQPSASAKITLFQTFSLAFLVLVVYVFLQTSVLQHFVDAKLATLPESTDRAGVLNLLRYDATVLSYIEIIGGTLSTLFLVALLRLRKIAVIPYLRLYPVKHQDWINGVSLLAGFIAVLSIIGWLVSYERPEFMQRLWQSCDNILLLLIAVAIIAPIFEETLFRGLLFNGIQESQLGTGAAIVLTAGLWAMIHAQYTAFDQVSIFLLGIIFALVRISSGSLVLPIALHSLFNTFAILEMAMFAENVAQ